VIITGAAGTTISTGKNLPGLSLDNERDFNNEYHLSGIHGRFFLPANELY
jgi:hypothetical protein